MILVLVTFKLHDLLHGIFLNFYYKLPGDLSLPISD